MTKKELENKKMLLYIGEPEPHPYFYQMGCIEFLFGEYSKWTEEERDKEHKRRVKLYKRAWKKYHIQRKKELDELKRLCKEEE